MRSPCSCCGRPSRSEWRGAVWGCRAVAPAAASRRHAACLERGARWALRAARWALAHARGLCAGAGAPPRRRDGALTPPAACRARVAAAAAAVCACVCAAPRSYSAVRVAEGWACARLSRRAVHASCVLAAPAVWGAWLALGICCRLFASDGPSTTDVVTAPLVTRARARTHTHTHTHTHTCPPSDHTTTGHRDAAQAVGGHLQHLRR
jgi:hypothetical protein